MLSSRSGFISLYSLHPHHFFKNYIIPFIQLKKKNLYSLIGIVRSNRSCWSCFEIFFSFCGKIVRHTQHIWYGNERIIDAESTKKNEKKNKKKMRWMFCLIIFCFSNDVMILILFFCFLNSFFLSVSRFFLLFYIANVRATFLYMMC